MTSRVSNLTPHRAFQRGLSKMSTRESLLLPILGEGGRGERAVLKKDVDMALVHKVRKPDTHGGGFLRYNELSYTVGTIRICPVTEKA